MGTGAATCSEGFIICFLKVPLACLGSMAAAVLPNSLWNSQKKVYKTFGTSGRPTQYLMGCIRMVPLLLFLQGSSSASSRPPRANRNQGEEEEGRGGAASLAAPAEDVVMASARPKTGRTIQNTRAFCNLAGQEGESTSLHVVQLLQHIIIFFDSSTGVVHLVAEHSLLISN